MTLIPIYTIGYGARSIEQFIAVLRRYGIEYLIDVRSAPYSRYKPDFSKSQLERWLQAHGIHYIYMGDTLGGQPADPDCYTDGLVDYEKVRGKPFFQEGIARLRTAWEKQLRVAIMCAEGKPQECHRSKLIASVLVEQGIGVAHIDETGETKTRGDRSSAHGQLSFFGDSFDISTSRKRYAGIHRRGEEVDES